MKYLSLDVGKKRIGVAISESGILARGYKTIHLLSLLQAIDDIIFICDKEKIEQIIIGLPLLPSGDESEQTKFVRNFKTELRKKTKLPIAFVNEYLTSKEAERILIERDPKISKDRRAMREKVDQISAVLILEEYLWE